ncbi:MAG: type I restriction enzyme HsdR N-terminal domain-containing protein [Planctomycetota bacterium]
MKDTLTDIRAKLQTDVYRNEEHVRLCLVARILQKLGWNIWDPQEVNAEFKVAPTEDKTKVDIALFLNLLSPCIFIEIKGPGVMAAQLREIETQVRDYNRNNTALFSVMTDGTEWRLYYSQTGGEFRDKCFKVIDILKDDPEDVVASFQTYLGKSQIESGDAKKRAEDYVELGKKQRAMADCSPHAKRMVQEPPFPSLPECLRDLVKERGFKITTEDAIKYLGGATEQKQGLPERGAITTNAKSSSPSSQPLLALEASDSTATTTKPSSLPRKAVRQFDSQSAPSVKFTRILHAEFDGLVFTKWNPLVEAAIKKALDSGVTLVELQSSLHTNLQSGKHDQDGYHPIEGADVSRQGVDADHALHDVVALARRLKVPFSVHLHWEKGFLADQEGKIEWKP